MGMHLKHHNLRHLISCELTPSIVRCTFCQDGEKWRLYLTLACLHTHLVGKAITCSSSCAGVMYSMYSHACCRTDTLWQH